MRGKPSGHHSKRIITAPDPAPPKNGPTAQVMLIVAMVSGCIPLASAWASDTGKTVKLTNDDYHFSIAENVVSRMGMKSQSILRIAKRHDCSKIEYRAGKAVYRINADRDQITSAWKGNAPKLVLRRVNSESHANPIDPSKIVALVDQYAGVAQCYK